MTQRPRRNASTSSPTSTPSPTPRGPLAFDPRIMFTLRASPPRLPIAWRAALCMFVLAAAGWLAADISAGLMATIGAFTSLYAIDRPYANRARVLAAIALALAMAVSLGVEAQHVAYAAVPLVVCLAMAATWMCRVLDIGPPGAYMFSLACAVSTAMPVGHASALRPGLYVLVGGALSWLVHMTGALFVRRAPERAAVAAAARAVAHFVDHAGTVDEDATRNQAALALHQAWTILITWQPASAPKDRALARLRTLTQTLHRVFAERVASRANTASETAALAAQARSIEAQANAAARDTSNATPADIAQTAPLPIGRLPTRHLIAEQMRLDAPLIQTLLRVGAGVAIAGSLSMAFGFEKPYWAMAAAVLVLHQGLNLARTLERSVARTVGTFVGIGAAGVLLAAQPGGLWLAIALAGLQFVVEMLVTRNYAFAVVFITSLAMLIASGGHRVADITALLLARGIDTALGCAVGVAVSIAFDRYASEITLRERVAAALDATATVARHADTGSVSSVSALHARSMLQHRLVALSAAYDNAVHALARKARQAQRWHPVVVATERLAYRVLAMCWEIESSDTPGDAKPNETSDALPDDARHALANTLAGIAGATHAQQRFTPAAPLPEEFATEIRDLIDAQAAFAAAHRDTI
ncbi:FUSC family protein [Pararobbsia silviterrae]|uniref:FUSC family protein n=1 Tax=Pararobbsia silviterrae TaxID=1792498 RepID=UPI001314FE79|nr:FUSC family protein [Pararobbsia silviterrae]